MSLLQLSFSGAVLILAVTVIRAAAINRLPKKVFLILWEISILRLLLPVSIPSIFSVYSLIERNAPIHDAVGRSPAAMLLPPAGNAALPAEIQPAAPAPTPAPVPTGQTVSAAFVIYFAIALLLAACFIASYLHYRMEFRASLPLSNEFTREWLCAHPLRRRLSIRISDRITAPLTYGILHPVILMPKKTDWNNRKQLQYVLEHEYIHICRWDALTKLIAAAALTVHWFNPLVWIMYILFNRDVELSCDECLVLRYGPDSRSPYALTLIGMKEEKSFALPLCSSFSKNAIEERITAIMKTKKLTLAVSLISAAVLITVVLMFATSAEAGSSGTHADSERSTAMEKLTAYLTTINYLREGMTNEGGEPMEWDGESAKKLELDGRTCYAFDLRFADDVEKNGQMAGRRAGTYAVSLEGWHVYDDTDGDNIWDEFPAGYGLSFTPDWADKYPICGIIRGMTEDTLMVEVVEFITADDTERVRELGLTEMDMPDGYHINMDDSKLVTWQLTDTTSYTFIDWGREFVENAQDPDSGQYCATMERPIFEEYLSGYPSFDEMKMPFFFHVEDGAVKGIFEYPLM